jgi:hypothetical protein
VLGADKEELDDGIDDVVAAAWRRVQDDWVAKLEKGKRTCSYRLAVFDAKGVFIEDTDPPFTARSPDADEDGSAEPASVTEYISLIKLQRAQLKDLESNIQKRDGNITDLLTQVVGLVKHLGSVMAAVPQPPPDRTAEFHAQAVVSAARAKEAGETMRHLITIGAPIVREFLPDDDDAVGQLEVLAELSNFDVPVTLITAVVLGDRAAAAEHAVPRDAAKFWAWIESGD